jgi:hypothetical protein
MQNFLLMLDCLKVVMAFDAGSAIAVGLEIVLDRAPVARMGAYF